MNKFSEIKRWLQKDTQRSRAVNKGNSKGARIWNPKKLYNLPVTPFRDPRKGLQCKSIIVKGNSVKTIYYINSHQFDQQERQFPIQYY